MTKEEKRIYLKEYRLKNKEVLAEKQRLKYLENKDSILLKNEQYRQANIEKVTVRRKEHYIENSERIIQTNIEYERENKESINLRKKIKRQIYRSENPLPINRGSYNITLAERHKEEWLKEKLFIYHIRMIDEDGTVFYKYGLAKNVKPRMHKIPYIKEMLEVKEFDKYTAIYMEHFLLKDKIQYTPIKAFKGYTECYI